MKSPHEEGRAAVDRELLLAALALLGGGPLLWIAAALLPLDRTACRAPGTSELAAWTTLWLPLIPTALLLAALCGWTLREPTEAEALGDWRLLFAVPTAIVWLRAFGRASASALRGVDGPLLAGTVGLLRPRAVVDPSLALRLDHDAHLAVLLHEEAHARHRDPLRIWLAHLVTDMAWPIPASRERLGRWLEALEIARDDEAVLQGADPVALADGIVTCARDAARPRAPIAAMTPRGISLDRRVRRLLDESVVRMPPLRRSPPLQLVTLSAATLVAVAAGSAYGEPIVRALVGIG